MGGNRYDTGFRILGIVKGGVKLENNTANDCGFGDDHHQYKHLEEWRYQEHTAGNGELSVNRFGAYILGYGIKMPCDFDGRDGRKLRDQRRLQQFRLCNVFVSHIAFARFVAGRWFNGYFDNRHGGLAGR